MDQRSTTRRITDRTVTCYVRGNSSEMIVADLSVQGCMIVDAPLTLFPGDYLSVNFAIGNAQRGIVVWRRAEGVGVRFLEPLELEFVESLGFKPSARAYEPDAMKDIDPREGA